MVILSIILNMYRYISKLDAVARFRLSVEASLNFTDLLKAAHELLSHFERNIVVFLLNGTAGELEIVSFLQNDIV